MYMLDHQAVMTKNNHFALHWSMPWLVRPVAVAAVAAAEMEPEDVYPVFPKQPKSVERLPDSKWSWDADEAAAPSAQQETPARLWNPRTGFMRTRAELEQKQAAGQVGASTQQPAHQAMTSSKSSAGSLNSSSGDRVVERLLDVRNPLQAPQLPPSALANAAAAVQAGSGELPAVGRGQVLASCALTAAAMSTAAVGLSLLAAKQSAALFGTSQETIDRLLQLPPGLQGVQQVGVMLGAAAAVTAARFVLKQQWPEFREATDRSNQQVLTSLAWPDVVLVALLSGVSEELLFRWALISGTWPDARGVLLSGAVFGVLHVSGGRNAAFAAWAAAVGWLYGAAFIATGNVWVPAGAHAIANFASAAAWISSNKASSD
jgi:membrane protease YdiL (CAAX protease family)